MKNSTKKLKCTQIQCENKSKKMPKRCSMKYYLLTKLSQIKNYYELASYYICNMNTVSINSKDAWIKYYDINSEINVTKKLLAKYIRIIEIDK
jgi:hypothetical protein